jgi:uncharacterized protein
MRFYDREKEVAYLRDIRQKSQVNARFTVITGRRRVGKTQLIQSAMGDVPYLYFYVGRKSEKDLCAGFQNLMKTVLGIPVVGAAEHFEDLAEVIFDEAEKRPITLVIDEFQDFYRVNPSVFSAMASLWDRHEKTAKLNLIVCGSINRLMNRIFRDEQEPLYGRNTGSLRIAPFKASVLKKILSDHAPNYANDDLLALWTFTGGVARYVQRLMDDGAFTREAMIRSIFSEGSSFLDEGLSLLVQEFGRDYETYFSILSAIASGDTEYSQIKNAVGTDVGAHLAKLENDYGLVRRKVPAFAKVSTKNSHYEIDDCFFRFWFRFVFKYQYLVELERFEQLQELVSRDFDAFSGFALERYFAWKFTDESSYTRMDAWWDRKGENEIDLVCEDELTNHIDFCEVKRDAHRFDESLLRRKAETFLVANPQKRSRQISCRGLSLADM